MSIENNEPEPTTDRSNNKKEKTQEQKLRQTEKWLLVSSLTVSTLQLLISVIKLLRK